MPAVRIVGITARALGIGRATRKILELERPSAVDREREHGPRRVVGSAIPMHSLLVVSLTCQHNFQYLADMIFKSTFFVNNT